MEEALRCGVDIPLRVHAHCFSRNAKGTLPAERCTMSPRFAMQGKVPGTCNAACQADYASQAALEPMPAAAAVCSLAIQVRPWYHLQAGMSRDAQNQIAEPRAWLFCLARVVILTSMYLFARRLMEQRYARLRPRQMQLLWLLRQRIKSVHCSKLPLKRT
jgi:hypothetical protein